MKILFPKKRFQRPATRLEDDEVKERYGVDTVHRLHANESPLGPSPAVVDAIVAEAAGVGQYPTMGDEALRETLARVWGRGLTAEHFFTGCSGYETIELVTRMFLTPGDEMIVSQPTFGIYQKLADQENAILVDAPLRLPDFDIDVDAVLAAVTERTKILLLCNPNNPTGTVSTDKVAMQRLIDELPEHVLILSDEVYFHYNTSDAFPDSVQYVLENRPVVLIHTFAKAYGMAGLRVGYGIAPPEIANYVGGVHRGFHQNRVALAAGVAALNDPAHLQKNIDMVVSQRRWLQDELDRLDLYYWPSEVPFLVIKLPTSHKPARIMRLMLEKGILIRALSGPGLDGCIRVSIGQPASNQAFIEALEGVLSQ